MSSWWKPKYDDEFRGMQEFLSLLSTLSIESATDTYLWFEDSYSDEFICKDCEALKEDCVCNEYNAGGRFRYRREYDDE